MDLKIFPYHNGKEKVWADPLEISHKLQKMLGGKAEQVIGDFYAKEPERSIPAYDRVHAAVCVAFGFEAFDATTGQGTMYEIWHGALEAYLDFFQRSEMSTGTSQMSAPPTEQVPSSQEA